MPVRGKCQHPASRYRRQWHVSVFYDRARRCQIGRQKLASPLVESPRLLGETTPTRGGERKSLSFREHTRVEWFFATRIDPSSVLQNRSNESPDLGTPTNGSNMAGSRHFFPFLFRSTFWYSDEVYFTRIYNVSSRLFEFH